MSEYDYFDEEKDKFTCLITKERKPVLSKSNHINLVAQLKTQLKYQEAKRGAERRKKAGGARRRGVERVTAC